MFFRTFVVNATVYGSLFSVRVRVGFSVRVWVRVRARNSVNVIVRVGAIVRVIVRVRIRLGWG